MQSSPIIVVVLGVCVGLCVAGGGAEPQSFDERRIEAARLAHDQGDMLDGILQPCTATLVQDVSQFLDNLEEAENDLNALKSETRDAGDRDAYGAVRADLAHVKKLIKRARGIAGHNRKIGRDYNDIVASTAALDHPTPCWYPEAERQSTACEGQIYTTVTSPPTTSVHMTVTNNYPIPIKVMWIHYNHAEQQYRILQPGQSYRQQTYTGHGWVFKGLLGCDENDVERRLTLTNGACYYAATRDAEQTVVVGPTE